LNLKPALYLRLGELLAAPSHLQSVPHKDSLDIVSGGFIFRLMFFASPEVERNTTALEYFIRRSTIAPMHHNAIKALQSQFPSFGNAVRLFSRWCAGNHFTGVLSHEVLELLVASCYIDPEIGVAPSSPTAGFKRALFKLRNHDWDGEALIVDFSAELSIEDSLRISAKFQKAREGNGGGPALFVVSSYDRVSGFDPSATDPVTLSKVVLRLLIAAASSSLATFDTWASTVDSERSASIANAIMDSAAPLFGNVTIRFSKSLFSVKRAGGMDVWDGLQRGPPFARLKIFSNMSSRETSLGNLIVKPSSNCLPCPVQEEIVARLRETFGDVALFFWNGIKGTEISIVWKPSAFLPEKLKILHVTNRIAVGTEGSAVGGTLSVLNTVELVTRMLACGAGAFDPQSVVFR